MSNLKLASLILPPGLREIHNYFFGEWETDGLDFVPHAARYAFTEAPIEESEENSWDNMLIAWRSEKGGLWYSNELCAAILRGSRERYLIAFDDEESFRLGLEELQAYLRS